MVLYDILFKPRRLPEWWYRFTEKYPIVPNFISIVGLALICISIANNVVTAEKNSKAQVLNNHKIVTKQSPKAEHNFSLREVYHNYVPDEVRYMLSELYGNIALYTVIPFLMFLEFFFPYNRNQPLVNKGFLQDIAWYFLGTPFVVLLLLPILHFLNRQFDQHLSFLSIESSKNWPVYLQIACALFLAECINWFNHFVRHKVKVLWWFHAVHHSQKDLNVFTDDRTHIFDLLVELILNFIPFFIFHVTSLYAVAIIGLYKPIHTRFIHSNLKINLGWLGWILTSPQFHRVHHSVVPEHFDKNFSVYFSFVDLIFGTAFPSRTVYPITGIPDLNFPLEEKVRFGQLPRNIIRQTIYPFKQVAARISQARDKFRSRRSVNHLHNEVISNGETNNSNRESLQGSRGMASKKLV